VPCDGGTRRDAIGGGESSGTARTQCGIGEFGQAGLGRQSHADNAATRSPDADERRVDTVAIVSFNQQGPPASAKQVAYIQALLRKAGYDDFRTARTEYRLTQRQARGKFTKNEASALIDRLTSTDDENPTVSVVEESDDFASAQSLLIRGFPADVLADELRRRGWSVAEPSK